MQLAYRGAITYPTAWWRGLGFARAHTLTDLPLGLLDHLSAEPSERAERAPSALTFYVDGKRGDYWRERFMPLPAGEWMEASHPFTAELHRMIARLYEPIVGQSLPSPMQAIVKDWQELGGAFHLWNASATPSESIRLARQPSIDEPVHICGEAWSPRQGWIEGALESVDEIIALLHSAPAATLSS